MVSTMLFFCLHLEKPVGIGMQEYGKEKAC